MEAEIDDESVSSDFRRVTLEHYVLWCMGELESCWRETLRDDEPRLDALFDGIDHWYALVQRRLGADAALADALRARWRRARDAVGARGGTLNPRHFARFVVEAELVPPPGAH